MARSMRRGMRRGGFRQGTDWGRITSTGQVTVAAASKVLLISTLPDESDETIRRTIINMHVISDQTAGTELQTGAIGCFIANDLAVTAGAASLLGPVTDQNDDSWLLWMAFSQMFQVISGAGVESDAGHQYVIDSKAQRKIQSGQRHVVMIENAHGSHGFNVMVSMSVLFGFGLKR